MRVVGLAGGWVMVREEAEEEVWYEDPMGAKEEVWYEALMVAKEVENW